MTLNTNGDILFNYKFAELREFYNRGIEFGDVGMIVVRRTKDNMITYKGFGTIEHPFKIMQSMTLKHNEFFDGPLPGTENRKVKKMMKYQYILLDCSGEGKHKIVDNIDGRIS